MNGIREMNKKKDLTRIDKLITETLAIEVEHARESGKLGYMARALAQATMPHSKTEGQQFTRVNGAYTLSIIAPIEIGLPYGTIPRLLIAWITTQAVKTRKREIILGSTLSNFMEQLGLTPSGGPWGSIRRLREQSCRLFSATVSCHYKDNNLRAGKGFLIADGYALWWDPKSPNQKCFWESNVTLTESFFNEIIEKPIPIHMDALKALKRSPMALDIYSWLTYRVSYLKQPVIIPWVTLQVQFGADYQDTRNFKLRFLQQLKNVLIVYQKAKVEAGDTGLILKPSKSHIPKIVNKPVN